MCSFQLATTDVPMCPLIHPQQMIHMLDKFQTAFDLTKLVFIRVKVRWNLSQLANNGEADLNMCSQKLSALPCGNTLVNSCRRWLRESFPLGHSDLKWRHLVFFVGFLIGSHLKERNQKRTVFSSNRVLLRQNSRSFFLRLFPVAVQVL